MNPSICGLFSSYFFFPGKFNNWIIFPLWSWCVGVVWSCIVQLSVNLVPLSCCRAKLGWLGASWQVEADQPRTELGWVEGGLTWGWVTGDRWVRWQGGWQERQGVEGKIELCFFIPLKLVQVQHVKKKEGSEGEMEVRTLWKKRQALIVCSDRSSLRNQPYFSLSLWEHCNVEELVLQTGTNIKQRNALGPLCPPLVTFGGVRYNRLKKTCKV